MKIGPHEEIQIWKGVPVNRASGVLIDGCPTDRMVRWFDPEEQTYGYYQMDDGKVAKDPDNPYESLIIVADGVVELVFEDDDSS